MTSKTIYHNTIKQRWTVWVDVKTADGKFMAGMPIAHEYSAADAKAQLEQFKQRTAGTEWTIERGGFYSEVVAA